MYKTDKRNIYMLWFYLFLGSFLIGVFIMNMAGDTLLTEEGIFSPSTMNRLKYIEIDSGKFFPFVLKQRMGSCILMLLLSTTGLGLAAVYIRIIWQGVLTGMIITAAAIRFGMKGLLLILAGSFPHQILLIPAGIMLLGWCYENCCHMHFAEKYTLPGYGNKKQTIIRQGGTLLWIAAVVLIGCILESYVNPILILDLIKIF